VEHLVERLPEAGSAPALERGHKEGVESSPGR
jgi:hypothetical protein